MGLVVFCVFVILRMVRLGNSVFVIGWWLGRFVVWGCVGGLVCCWD